VGNRVGGPAHLEVEGDEFRVVVALVLNQWAGILMETFDEWFGEKEAWAQDSGAYSCTASGSEGIEITRFVCDNVYDEESGETGVQCEGECAYNPESLDEETGEFPPATVTVACSGAFELYETQPIDCGVVGAQAVCGNGEVEEGEDCDDWNTKSGDGCDSLCREECYLVVQGTVDPKIVEGSQGHISIRVVEGPLGSQVDCGFVASPNNAAEGISPLSLKKGEARSASFTCGIGGMATLKYTCSTTCPSGRRESRSDSFTYRCVSA